MVSFLFVIHFVVAAALIIVILIQPGKGSTALGGGAQNFTYAYKFCAADGPFRCGFGSEGNQSITIFDNNYDYTGSTTWGMFAADELFGNVGTGNPNYFGAGGNAPIVGGKASCRDNIACVTSDSPFCSITQSRDIPARFYGAGGNGYGYYVCNCSDAVLAPICVEVQGAQGNDGIVVLTWYE